MMSEKENKRKIPLAIRFRNNLKGQLVKYKQVDKLVHESDPEAGHTLASITSTLQPVQAAFDMSVITAMADQIKQLTDRQIVVAKQVNEVHAVQVGKLFNAIEEKQKPKKLTLKQQREQKEKEQEILIENLRNYAMRRKLNGL